MKAIIKSAEKKIKAAYSAWYKANFHLKEKNFENIEALSKKQRKSIVEFWQPYHCRFNINFLQYYCNFQGISDYYIPDDIWYNKILPYYNEKLLAKQIDDKCLYDLYLRNIRMPETVVRIIDGRLYDKDYNRVSYEEADKLIKESGDVIVKPSVNSCGGKGIRCLAADINVDCDDIIKEYSNAIIQKVIQQSDCLEKLNNSSLNTIRICSLVMNVGTFHIPSATMRMGANGAFVDNVCSGGYFVGINLQDGTLKKYAYSRSNAQYEKCEKHPNSGVIFEGYKIKGFPKVMELVANNAKYLPKTRLVGWDISIDKNDEPVLIEVNLEDHELELVQIANGPYFGSKQLTQKVLNEVYGMHR